MNCEFCHKPTHVWYECKDKPPGWKPARLAKKSTATRIENGSRQSSLSTVPDALGSGRSRRAKDLPQSVAAADVLPVDTNSSPRLLKGSSGIGLASPAKIRDAEAADNKDALILKPGRPKTGFDKAAYNRN